MRYLSRRGLLLYSLTSYYYIRYLCKNTQIFCTSQRIYYEFEVYYTFLLFGGAKHTNHIEIIRFNCIQRFTPFSSFFILSVPLTQIVKSEKIRCNLRYGLLSGIFFLLFSISLFPVCFFWLFGLSGSIDIQYFTFRKQIIGTGFKS